ncbi:MAG: 3-isopropylmalate dehydratase small subunit [Gammaproteobacteria bacterium AqS3]|nr:3-isopropylmalate dehydratase small subunit [Gammaproteobacteria bacterium AqS3]
MTPFEPLTGIAVPMPQPNIDTDAIIPSRAIRGIGREGLAEGLFANWRYLPGGLELNPGFVLNRPEYAGAQILLGGANFGCGSSREQAVWALQEFGFRAVIAPGFGDIFRRNCINNGLLPVVMPAEAVTAMARWVEEKPQWHKLRINLQAGSILPSEGCPAWLGETLHKTRIELDDDEREMLLRGIDPIDLTLRRLGDDLDEFEKRHLGKYWYLRNS